MKKIIVAISAAMVLGVVSISSADPQPTQTPITERTYADFTHDCNTSCNATTGHSNDPKYRYYCSCACAQGEMNYRGVVSRDHLLYEEQVPIHISEIMPNAAQLTMCRGKAGI